MITTGEDFYRVFDRFEKLPEHCKNPLGAYQWFRAIAPTVDVKISYELMQQIPLSLISDDLRKHAISLSVIFLNLIEPDHTPAYNSLCLMAYGSSYKAMKFFRPEVCTLDTVEWLLKDSRAFISFFKAYQEFPWIAQVMTPAMVEKASMISDKFMLTLPDDQISKAALEKHLGEGPYTFKELKKAGRLQLGVAYLKNGGWPEQNGPFDDPLPKPESLLEAFSLLLGVENSARALHMAYVMTHDIEDVMALVVAPSCAKLAVEIYGEKELRPYIKSNRHLKAALLEESLGL